MKLIGCFDFLADHGFFTAEELQEALVVLADDLDVRGLEQVVDVVVGFKLAGSERGRC